MIFSKHVQDVKIRLYTKNYNFSTKAALIMSI